MKVISKIFDFFASIKLAVFVIIALAVLAAVGTVVEARYDADMAKHLVYGSVYMYGVLGLLCANLIGVMIDRWPWKKRHTGFLMAHIGIITTLIGALLTQFYGIDGTLRFEVGQSAQHVSLPQRELSVYSSFDGQSYSSMFHKQVDFLSNAPSKKDPLIIPLGQDELQVIDYYHYAVRNTRIKSSEKKRDGPAVRFQLSNDRVNTAKWLRLERRQSSREARLGPARVVLTRGDYTHRPGQNAIVFKVSEDSSLRYQIYGDESLNPVKSGALELGQVVPTGWMDLKLRLLRFLPHSREKVTYERREFPNKVTRSAIQVKFQGDHYWLGLNSGLRLFQDNKMYLINYGNKRLNLGFKMRLKEFEMGRYQGTNRAASYKSRVAVEGLGDVTISMNEPLDYQGFTFYQSSFEKNAAGKPVASILSVNNDPGRWVKYAGSALVVLGSTILFYSRRRRKRKNKKNKSPSSMETAV